jgi:4-amino-4-deoxy-L-arabinose transferase-like glycosyltransferase
LRLHPGSGSLYDARKNFRSGTGYVRRLLNPPIFPLTDSSSGIADLLTLTLGLLVLTFGIGDYALYEPHEGHFAGVAREMLLRGDWITPTLNGAPYLNKPPLLYWLISGSQALLGLTEFAARLPVALTGWLGVLVVWKWARELWHPTAGRLAAAILYLSTGWFIFTHQILLDLFLGSLLIAVHYCLWRLIWSPRRRYWLCFWGLLGLCFLAKGPVGLIYVLMACLSLAIRRQNWRIFAKLHLPIGLGILFCMTLPWLIAVELANPGFWHYFGINEHLNRAAGTRFPPDYEVSTTSIGGYLGLTAVWAMPWTLLLPLTGWTAWQTWLKVGDRLAHPDDRRRSDGILLLVVALLCPLLLFLPLSSRLIYYSLPSLPPLAILTAGGIWYFRAHLRRLTEVAGLGLMALGSVAIGSAFWVPYLIKAWPHVRAIAPLQPLFPTILVGCGAGLVFAGFCLRLQRWQLSGVLGAAALLSVYLAIPTGLQAVEPLRSAKQLIATADPRLGSQTLWTFEGSRELGAAGAMSYYLGKAGHLPPALPPAQTSPHLPAGWIAARGGQRVYRTVLVLAESGSNRLLPRFPGDRPAYVLSKSQLQTYWNSDRPVVFVTDFLRVPNDPRDPIRLNLPQPPSQPLLTIGPRQLYGNAAAHRVWKAGKNKE